MTAFETILAPLDFSDQSKASLRQAVELARTFGARLHLVHVYQIPVYGGVGDYGAIQAQLLETVREGAGKALGDAVEEARKLGIEAQPHLREGFPAERIVDVAREIGADLIVMGTHGRTGLQHLLLGSVAERTLRTAPCAVLTVPAHPEAGEGEGNAGRPRSERG